MSQSRHSPALMELKTQWEADINQPNIKPQLTQVQVQGTMNVCNEGRSREASLVVKMS